MTTHAMIDCKQPLFCSKKKKKKKLSKHDIQGAGGEAANHELRLYVLAQLFAFFPVDFLAKERLLAV